MIIDLTRLNNAIDKEILINETYSFTEEELIGTDVKKLDDISISGTISLNAIGNIVLSLDVDGTMVIPCAITLKEVQYPFSISINEDLDDISIVNGTNCQNSLDILSIIWENILMEIPMRVVSEDAKDLELSGEGWKLIREEKKEENAELSKLRDLL